MSLQQAPHFTLEHLKGRQVSLTDYRGRPVAIVVGGKDSAEQAKQIGRDLRSRYNPEQLPIISVVHLKGVPRLVQGIVKRQVEKDYPELVRDELASLQAAGRPVPPDESQVAVMLLDWDGKVAESYGLSGVDQQAVAVLIDGEGYIRGYGAGAQGGQQVLSLFA